MMKKALWTALVTAATALGATMAHRLVDRAWRRVTREPPPETPSWARLLVAWPVARTVTRSVQADRDEKEDEQGR